MADTIGIKISSYPSVAECINIIRKHTGHSMSIIKNQISSNEYVVCVDYTDHEGIKKILSCYSDLKAAGIQAQLYELFDAPATEEFVRNLISTYDEISEELTKDQD